MFRDLWYGTLDLFLPVACLSCGEFVETRERPVPLCGNCVGKLPALEPPACYLCARPMGPPESGDEEATFEKSDLCGDCRTRDHTLSATHAGYEYRDLLSSVVGDWKFDGHSEWGTWLGAQLADRVASRINPADFDLVQPIPLHEDRRDERGFNQARQLARALSQTWSIPVADRLEKTRRTAPQSELSREERLDNLRGAFSVSGEGELSDRRLILVDDIYTTGSTLRTATRVLLEEGAESVTAVVFARAV